MMLLSWRRKTKGRDIGCDNIQQYNASSENIGKTYKQDQLPLEVDAFERPVKRECYQSFLAINFLMQMQMKGSRI